MALSEQQEEQIAVGMFDRGLLGFPKDGVVLKSGRLSPYYYNMRPCLSFKKSLDRSGVMPIPKQREFRKALSMGYAALMSDISQPIDHVFGKAQAGTAPVAVGAYEAGLSYLWERVDEPGKTYGYHQKIEGDYEAGETILLADDVATDGNSKIEGAQVLTAVDLEPRAITLEFDRQEGGVQTLENDYLFEVNSVMTLTKAAQYLLSNSRIGNEQIDALQAYHASLRADNLVSTFEF